MDCWLLVEATTVDLWCGPSLDLSRLEADHEEADTRLILHCIHALMESVVVSVHDTDVLVLLQMDRCLYLFMKAGTSKHIKCVGHSKKTTWHVFQQLHNY